ncbi:DUF255 domain-containing protein [Candidatus Formimonas warabiya]|uniref:Spermatogenesis-associated protein 20-like TRX domain-containing protein n=1 Tax=Formimonas warabiya TaxID=1761012 RepID=A0A3G1KV06_FORW1|nr:DUF255 domain-containing protein [Candidatus Formimonas warabiya]ATW26247.1 hypothetical protein DCMF_17100 [Candidatus Formimonas warabiya]
MPCSINWFPWGNDTFEQASVQKKPIMMYLTAPWCGWCAVMEDTTYQDPQVIHIIERNFIPMKVNVDQYPHVADRYHYGGYPSIVFLSGEGHILKGENYLPGEQMKSLLEEVLHDVSKRKRVLAPRNGEKQANLPAGFNKENMLSKKMDKDCLSLGQIDHVMEIIKKAYDHEFGGFVVYSAEAKFPFPEINDFLISYTEKNFCPEAETMLTHTLDVMSTGEIYDREKGGFFRLCEGQNWTLPHGEKLLESNAGLLRNYLLAFNRWGEERYERVAQDTLRYLIDHLFDPGVHAFGGSQIGHEVDFSPFANWNGMMVSSLLLAYRVFGEKKYLEIALAVLHSFWAKCYRLGRGMSHFFFQGPSEVELFSDQVKFICALWEAYNCTRQIDYLEKAQLLMKHVYKNYRLPEGYFGDIPLASANPGYLDIPLVPFVENAELATVFLNMACVLGDRSYAQKATRLLKSLHGLRDSNPVFAAKYGLGLLERENYRSQNQTFHTLQ